MSKATGQVKFPDGKIMFYLYYGTVDVELRDLYETFDAMHEFWEAFNRSMIGIFSKRVCECDKNEPIEIATDYGGGMWWEGRACRYCMVINKGRYNFNSYQEPAEPGNTPAYFYYNDDLPNWWIKNYAA